METTRLVYYECVREGLLSDVCDIDRIDKKKTTTRVA